MMTDKPGFPSLPVGQGFNPLSWRLTIHD